MGRGSGSRRGITLFEVVVAMVIFALTLPALNALVEIGTRRAEDSAFMARASMECRSKLAEVTVGAEPLNSTDWTPLTDANWYWKASVTDGDVDGLKQVQVSVKYDLGSGVPMKVTLGQMIIDPSMRGSTQDRAILAGNLGGNSNNSATPSQTDPNASSNNSSNSGAGAIPSGLGSKLPGTGAAGKIGGTGGTGATGSGKTGGTGGAGAAGASGGAGISGAAGATGAAGGAGGASGTGGTTGTPSGSAGGRTGSTGKGGS